MGAKNSYQNSIGYVDQNPFLFNDTILNNIKWGSKNKITKNAIFEISKQLEKSNKKIQDLEKQSKVLSDKIAKALEKQDYKEIQTLYTKSSINQLIIGGVLFLCIWLNIDEIFSLLPSKFQGGKWVVFYIAIAQMFNMLTGINGTIIVNSRYYRYDLYTNVILVFTTITTNYFLILRYGINGAAMATAISILLFNLIRLILIKVNL